MRSMLLPLRVAAMMKGSIWLPMIHLRYRNSDPSQQSQPSRRRGVDVLVEDKDAVIPRSGWILGRRCYYIGDGTTNVISKRHGREALCRSPPTTRQRWHDTKKWR